MIVDHYSSLYAGWLMAQLYNTITDEVIIIVKTCLVNTASAHLTLISNNACTYSLPKLPLQRVLFEVEGGRGSRGLNAYINEPIKLHFRELVWLAEGPAASTTQTQMDVDARFRWMTQQTCESSNYQKGMMLFYISLSIQFDTMLYSESFPLWIKKEQMGRVNFSF